MSYTDQSVTLIVLISQDRLVNQLLNTDCDVTIIICEQLLTLLMRLYLDKGLLLKISLVSLRLYLSF